LEKDAVRVCGLEDLTQRVYQKNLCHTTPGVPQCSWRRKMVESFDGTAIKKVTGDALTDRPL